MYDCRIPLVFWISSGVIRYQMCLQCERGSGGTPGSWGDPLHDPLDDDNPRARDTKPGIRITSSQITQISHQTEEPGSLSGLVPNDLVTQASSFSSLLYAITRAECIQVPFNSNSCVVWVRCGDVSCGHDKAIWYRVMAMDNLGNALDPSTVITQLSDALWMLCFKVNWQ